MLTKHFNQTIVVHILRDMLLNPTFERRNPYALRDPEISESAVRRSRRS